MPTTPRGLTGISIVRDDQFVDLPAPGSFAVDQPPCGNPIDGKSRVHRIKEGICRVLIFGIRVAQHALCSGFVQFPVEFCKPFLISVREPVLAIGIKKGGIIERAVGGVEIHECLCIDEWSAGGKIAMEDPGVL